jgi:predicted AAA+ superfamily ATPase
LVKQHLHKTNSLDSLQGHPFIGISWKGYAIEQIKQFVQDKYELYFYRTQIGAECDLLIVDGTKVVYAIEIKYSSVPKIIKGYINSIEDVNAQQNFIIKPNSDDYLIKEHIRVCSLSVFLTTHLN